MFEQYGKKEIIFLAAADIYSTHFFKDYLRFEKYCVVISNRVIIIFFNYYYKKALIWHCVRFLLVILLQRDVQSEDR